MSSRCVGQIVFDSVIIIKMAHSKKSGRKPRGWGGAREGAGRRPLLCKPKLLAVRIDGSDLDALERLAARKDLPLADYLRRLIKRHVRAARSNGRAP